MRLASHLGMSLRQVQKETSSREFVLWMARLDEEWQENTKLDYYLAQIAAMIEAVNSKEPQNVTTQGRLLKFEERRPSKPLHKMTPEERQEAIDAQKAAFIGWAKGASRRGQPKDRKSMREKK